MKLRLPNQTSKYHARPTVTNSMRFASKLEATRYQELLLLEKAGTITDLQLQPRFPLAVNNVPICVYVADFSYWDVERQKKVVEDVKGMVTAAYRIKRQLMKALHIEITEIGDSRK